MILVHSVTVRSRTRDRNGNGNRNPAREVSKIDRAEPGISAGKRTGPKSERTKQLRRVHIGLVWRQVSSLVTKRG